MKTYLSGDDGGVRVTVLSALSMVSVLPTATLALDVTIVAAVVVAPVLEAEAEIVAGVVVSVTAGTAVVVVVVVVDDAVPGLSDLLLACC